MSRIISRRLARSRDEVLVGAREEVVAVIAAAEEHYSEWARANYDQWALLPKPMREIGRALAKLNEKLEG